TVTWAQLESIGVDGPDSLSISLSVRDGAAGDPATNVATDTAQATVTNAAPLLTLFDAPSTAGRGVPITISFSADDFSSLDEASGLQYVIDWSDGPNTVGTTSGDDEFIEATHVFNGEGTFTITVT